MLSYQGSGLDVPGPLGQKARSSFGPAGSARAVQPTAPAGRPASADGGPHPLEGGDHQGHRGPRAGEVALLSLRLQTQNSTVSRAAFYIGKLEFILVRNSKVEYSVLVSPVYSWAPSPV